MVNHPHLRTPAAATTDRSPSGRERAAAAPGPPASAATDITPPRDQGS